jgi:hypothetical protein
MSSKKLLDSNFTSQYIPKELEIAIWNLKFESQKN